MISLIESLKIIFSKINENSAETMALEQVIPKESISMGDNNILISNNDILHILQNATSQDRFKLSVQIKYNEYSTVSVSGTKEYIQSVIDISDIKKTLGSSSFLIGSTTSYGPFSNSPASFSYSVDNNSVINISNSLVTILTYGIVDVRVTQLDFS